MMPLLESFGIDKTTRPENRSVVARSWGGGLTTE